MDYDIHWFWPTKKKRSSLSYTYWELQIMIIILPQPLVARRIWLCTCNTKFPTRAKLCWFFPWLITFGLAHHRQSKITQSDVRHKCRYNINTGVIGLICVISITFQRSNGNHDLKSQSNYISLIHRLWTKPNVALVSSIEPFRYLRERQVMVCPTRLPWRLPDIHWKASTSSSRALPLCCTNGAWVVSWKDLKSWKDERSLAHFEVLFQGQGKERPQR